MQSPQRNGEVRKRALIVLTGATGFLGSHVLYHLLRANAASTSGPAVFTLVRATDDGQAQARVGLALEVAATSYSEPLPEQLGYEALTADITQPLCGLTELSLDRLRATGTEFALQVWHLAASLSFEERDRDAIFSNNLAGTRHALDLARAVQAERFVYVSTAYTAGTTGGQIEERLHPVTGTFCNAYEESKNAAEHEVVDACQAAGIDWRILRPSIVVGPSSTLKSGGTATGLYGFQRELYRMRRLLRDVSELEIQGDPALSLNLVPVDHVALDFVRLFAANFAGGPIYHLTATTGPKTDACLAEMCSSVDIPRMRIAHRTRAAIPIESLLDERTKFYGAYLKHDKQFVRSLPSHAAVDMDQVRGYIAEYHKELLKTDRESIFRREVIKAADGGHICVFHAGSAAGLPLVLVNAYGMTADVWIPFVRALGSKYRIVTWETRGLPNLSSEPPSDRAPIDAHARDLEAVLDSAGMPTANVAAWCSGAQVALRFAALHPERVQAAALLNGYYRLPDAPMTEFHRDLYTILPACAEDASDAQVYCDIIRGRRDREGSAAQHTVRSLFGKVDATLMHLTSAPFRSGLALHRFARMLMAFREPTPSDWWPESKVRTLVVTAERDGIAHPDGSRAVAERLLHGQLLVRTQGDHYLLYHDAELPQVVDRFFCDDQSMNHEEQREVPAHASEAISIQ